MGFCRLVQGLCCGNKAFLTSLMVGIYWEMIKSSKRGASQKEENQISIGGEGLFFFFINRSKLLSHFVPVFPDTALRERSLR